MYNQGTDEYKVGPKNLVIRFWLIKLGITKHDIKSYHHNQMCLSQIYQYMTHTYSTR